MMNEPCTGHGYWCRPAVPEVPTRKTPATPSRSLWTRSCTAVPAEESSPSSTGTCLECSKRADAGPSAALRRTSRTATTSSKRTNFQSECPVQFHFQKTLYSCWRRVSVVRTSVFGWRTFPDLCPIYGWHVTTLWVKCPLWVTQPGQLSLPSLRGR